MYSVVLLLLSASGFLVQQIKDGGARPEGMNGFVLYEGPLTMWPYFTAALALALMLYKALRIGSISYGIRRESYKSPEQLRIPPWIAFVGFLCASIFWSVETEEAIKSVFLTGSCIIIAALLTSTHAPSEIRQGVFLFSALSAATSYFLIIAIPTWGVSVGMHEGFWQGAYSHKNILGPTSAALASWHLAYRAQGDRAKTNIILLCGNSILTLGSGSFSSIGALVLALLVYTLTSPTTNRKLASSLAAPYSFRSMLALLSGFALTALMLILTSYPDVFSIAGKGTDFSGRKYIWDFFLNQISNQPLLGYGLNQLTDRNEYRLDLITNAVGYTVFSIHNGFLECLYSVGIVGTIFLFYLLHSDARSIRSFLDFRFFLIIAIPCLFLNTLESRLLVSSVQLFALVCAVRTRTLPPQKRTQ